MRECSPFPHQDAHMLYSDVRSNQDRIAFVKTYERSTRAEKQDILQSMQENLRIFEFMDRLQGVPAMHEVSVARDSAQRQKSRRQRRPRRVRAG